MTQPSLADLRAELEAAGCFRKSPIYAAMALLGNLAAAFALFVLSANAAAWWLAVPCFMLGSFFFYRLGFLMHDAAHAGTCVSPAGNRFFAALTAGILGEFPSGWRHGHNRHHASPNVRGRDMDQRERWDPTRRYSSRWKAWLGLFSFTRIKGIYVPSSLLFLCLRDGYFCFIARRENFVLELGIVLLSFAAQLAFFTWLFGLAPGILLFFAHTHIGMIYLNAVFAANHYDLANYAPEEAAALPYEELQAHTTRNYSGGWLIHFFSGGLDKQLEHHLFPSIPRHRLAQAAPMVRAFCARRGLPYHEESFFRSFGKVLAFHVNTPHVASSPR